MKNNKCLAIFLLLFFIIAAPLFSGKGSEIEEKKKQLEEIQARLEQEKKKEREIKRDAEKGQEGIKKARQALETIKKNLQSHQRNLTSTQRKLSAANKNLEGKEKEFAGAYSLSKERISIYYKKLFASDEGTLLNASLYLLGGEDPGEKTKALALLARSDGLLLQEIEEGKEKLKKEKGEIEKEKERYARLTAAQKRREKEKQEEEKKEREKLAKIQQGLKDTQARQKELASQAKQLEALLKELAKERKIPDEIEHIAPLAFNRERDGYRWPVSKGRVVNYYGWIKDSRYKTSLFSPGIDIEVEGATEVNAVSAGKVIFSGPFSGYGQMLIVDHGGGYCSVYGGLDRVGASLNQQVQREQILGTVSRRLHFEIRQGVQSLDPLNWIKAH